MAYQLDNKMVIGVSSRALFDLTFENGIFESRGVEAYCSYQIEHETEVLKPGPGFELIRSLLELNTYSEKGELVEVIIMSHNSPDTSLRVFNSIRHYGLDITRAVLVSGASLAPYLTAFHTDLFLSANQADVQCAIDNGIAAGIICTENIPSSRRVQIAPTWENAGNDRYPSNSIRIAFDGDAVLFTDESERIYQEKGLLAFEENEARNARNPLEEGPFANFLRKLSQIRRELGEKGSFIRTALVTSRCAPAHERVLRTLRTWDVKVDEVFFLGGVEKKDVLKAFGAQIFFDDQQVHTISASKEVPAALVPYCRNRKRESLSNEIPTYRTG